MWNESSPRSKGDWGRDKKSVASAVPTFLPFRKQNWPNFESVGNNDPHKKRAGFCGLAHLDCTAEANNLLVISNCWRTNSAIRRLLSSKPRYKKKKKKEWNWRVDFFPLTPMSLNATSYKSQLCLLRGPYRHLLQTDLFVIWYTSALPVALHKGKFDCGRLTFKGPL